MNQKDYIPVKLTRQILQQYLDYRPDTGEFFWKVKTRRNGEQLKLAGCVGSIGRRIQLNGVSYLASHLAVFYIYGRMTKHTIFHLNGNKLDNRINNLREITLGESIFLKESARSLSKLHTRNIHKCKDTLKYRLALQVGDTRKQLYGDSIEDLKPKRDAIKQELLEKIIARGVLL